MINIKHLLKVSAVWVSVAYVICFVAVALYPEIRTQFMQYALHTEVVFQGNMITFGNFVAGLIWWNVLAFLSVGFFAVLFNKIKH